MDTEADVVAVEEAGPVAKDLGPALLGPALFDGVAHVVVVAVARGVGMDIVDVREAVVATVAACDVSIVGGNVIAVVVGTAIRPGTDGSKPSTEHSPKQICTFMFRPDFDSTWIEMPESLTRPSGWEKGACVRQNGTQGRDVMGEGSMGHKTPLRWCMQF